MRASRNFYKGLTQLTNNFWFSPFALTSREYGSQFGSRRNTGTEIGRAWVFNHCTLAMTVQVAYFQTSSMWQKYKLPMYLSYCFSIFYFCHRKPFLTNSESVAQLSWWLWHGSFIFLFGRISICCYSNYRPMSLLKRENTSSSSSFPLEN